MAILRSQSEPLETPGDLPEVPPLTLAQAGEESLKKPRGSLKGVKWPVLPVSL